MVETIKKLLENENIFLYKFIPLDKCVIKKKYLLDKSGIEDGFAVIFAIGHFAVTVKKYKEN